jgi:hypothetical protein
VKIKARETEPFIVGMGLVSEAASDNRYASVAGCVRLYDRSGIIRAYGKTGLQYPV